MQLRPLGLGSRIAFSLLLVSPTLVYAQGPVRDVQTVEPADWANAVRTGTPRLWAATLETIGHSSRIPPAVVNQLITMLRDRSPEVRLRAVLAIGAAGPEASYAGGPLATLLEDPDDRIPWEVGVALGAINGLAEPGVLRILFRTAVRDSVNRLRNRLESDLARYNGAPIAIDEVFAEELRGGLTASQPVARRWAVLVASVTSVRWLAAEFVRLLADKDPTVRRTAMFALAALQPTAQGAREAIERLGADSDKRVRDSVRDALGMLMTGRQPIRGCLHRGRPAATSLGVTIDPASASLRDDGHGRYKHGVDRVRTVRSFAFNLLLSASVSNPLYMPVTPADTTGPFTNRALLFDLSRPAAPSSAQPIGVVRDSSAVLHFHWMWDPGRRADWSLDEMPVGGTGASDRVQFEVSIAGYPHILQFGPWAQGDCGEPYAFGAKISGNGTTRVQIERTAVDEYRLWAPAGSIARLWDYREPQNPRDLGLYFFSFSLRLAPVP